MRDRDAPLDAAGLGALAWGKMDGMLPAIIQDADTGQVLMLGYMDRLAADATLRDGFVTFFSRSKGRLWQKGETSGNRLTLVAMLTDCDNDAILVKARPAGPTCHLDTTSCFGTTDEAGPGWLGKLTAIVEDRAAASPDESYTARLLAAGLPRIAQKIGEEGVEIALAAVTRDNDGCVEEMSDLLYHLTVLMQARGIAWADVTAKLQERHAG